MPLALLLLLAAAALVTATISAILGMGGGLTLLGILTLTIAPGLVVPLHGVVQLISNLTRSFAFRRSVVGSIFAVFAVPTALGMWLATQLWSGDKLGWFRPLIGLFILGFLAWRRFQPKLRTPPLWSYAVLGLVVGFVAIFVGATGPFLAPFYLREDFRKEQIIGTKAACQAWLHLLKIPAFLSLGFDYRPHLPLLGALLVMVVAGTYLGRWLLGRLSRERFMQAFQLVLAVMALYLIGGSLL